MKAIFLRSSLVVTLALCAGSAYAKKDKKKWCHVCKAGAEMVEFEGKACLTAKEKKKFSKECKAKNGKWGKEEESKMGAAAPSEDLPMNEGGEEM